MSIVTQKRVKAKRQQESLHRPFWPFTFVVVGILARWFWPAAWAYLADPTQPFFWEALPTFPVRLVLSVCIAALIFLPIYQKIHQLSTETWVICLISFQCGFFWQSLLFSVMQSFR